jgi:hypothetical protein
MGRGGYYSTKNYVASFVGFFFPAGCEPKYSCIVVVHNLIKIQVIMNSVAQSSKKLLKKYTQQHIYR